jgi:hypothetical protein
VLALLKNRHVVVAMIIAPVLAIISYVAVDHYVAEPPQAAVSGNSYPLLAMSNCRYQSGRCTLKNGDVEVHLDATHDAGGAVVITLDTALALDGAMIATAVAGEESLPRAMTPAAAGGWQTTLMIADPAVTTLRFAMNIHDTLYYAETAAVFIDYETGFSRENFTR